MKATTFYLLAIPALLAALAAAPGCESKTKIANTAPGDVALSASKCFIETGGTITLSATAIDDDGDPLTFRWTAAAGTFSPASGIGASVQWEAPSSPGVVTISLAVTDEIETVTKTQNITACTRFPSPVPPAATTTVANTGAVYIVKNVGLLTIPSSATLTIEPGVTIVFDSGGGGFEAYGRVIAEGTPGSKIRFRGNTCGASSGLWDGIYLYGQLGPFCEGVFRNVEISAGMNGIQVTDGAKLTLDRSTVYDNSNIGISVVHEMSVAHILSSDIWDNGIGIEITNARVDIASSAIQYNGSNGLEVAYSSSETNVTIDSTIIANNGSNGIMLSNLAAPMIRYCSIYSNSEESANGYAIRLAGHIGSDTIRAQHNFWGPGVTTEQQIGQLIFDGVDQPGLAYVDFRNWLSESPTH